MYFALIDMLFVSCWPLVISQPTWRTDQNKCEVTSSKTKVLLEKIVNMESEISRLKQFVSITTVPSDCTELPQMQPFAGSASYTWRPYCDMTTDGGSWLVFQRRQDGSENFYRNWTDYKHGFGRLDGEFWLGNDVLASITHKKSYELRVDLEDFDGNKAYAVYSDFSIAGEEDQYRLTVGEYSGTAGDSLSWHNGQQFSTFDSDTGTSCAVRYKGAWWYNACHYSNLNGQYQVKDSPLQDGVIWRHFAGWYYSLKFTEMKMRPK